MLEVGPPSLHYCCADVLRSSIVLPHVGHSSNHEYHCCQLRVQSIGVSNFYHTFKSFHLTHLLIYIHIYTHTYTYNTYIHTHTHTHTHSRSYIHNPNFLFLASCRPVSCSIQLQRQMPVVLTAISPAMLSEPASQFFTPGPSTTSISESVDQNITCSELDLYSFHRADQLLLVLNINILCVAQNAVHI